MTIQLAAPMTVSEADSDEPVQSLLNPIGWRATCSTPAMAGSRPPKASRTLPGGSTEWTLISGDRAHAG